MSGFHVTCINRNPAGLIIRIGGADWSMSLAEAISGLVYKRLRLTILIGNEYFDIGLRGQGSNTYLVVEPEGKALAVIEGLYSC